MHNAYGDSYLTSCCLRQPVRTGIPSLYLRPQAHEKVLPPALTSFVLLLTLFSLLHSPCCLPNLLDFPIKIFPQNPFPHCPTGATTLCVLPPTFSAALSQQLAHAAQLLSLVLHPRSSYGTMTWATLTGVSEVSNGSTQGKVLHSAAHTNHHVVFTPSHKQDIPPVTIKNHEM